MTISIALVTGSVAIIAGLVLVFGIIRGWLKLGSTLIGSFCGVLIGASIIGPRLTRWVADGLDVGSGWLAGSLAAVSINGWHPARSVPSWGWRVIIVCLAVTLLATVVGALDGARGRKSGS